MTKMWKYILTLCDQMKECHADVHRIKTSHTFFQLSVHGNPNENNSKLTNMRKGKNIFSGQWTHITDP